MKYAAYIKQNGQKLYFVGNDHPLRFIETDKPKLYDSSDALARTVDTVDGRPVFNDGGDLYEIVPALDGLLDWMGLYAKKSGRHINLEPFEQLKQQLHFSMPVQSKTFESCKSILPEMQRFVALMPAKEALSNLTTVQISGKLHGKYGNDNRYTGAVCTKT